MGIPRIKRKEVIKELRRTKKLNEMLEDFSRVLEHLSRAEEALQNFMKKWGGSEELKLLIQQGELDDLLVGLKLQYKPSLLERLLGRDVDVLAATAMSLLKRAWPPIVSVSEAFLRLKIAIPDLSVEKFNRLIDKLEELGFVTKRVKGEDESEYLFLPRFHEYLKEVLEKLRPASSKGITLSEAAELLGVSVGLAEVVLESLVEMGIATKEEFPRKYYLAS